VISAIIKTGRENIKVSSKNFLIDISFFIKNSKPNPAKIIIENVVIMNILEGTPVEMIGIG